MINFSKAITKTKPVQSPQGAVHRDAESRSLEKEETPEIF